MDKDRPPKATRSTTPVRRDGAQAGGGPGAGATEGGRRGTLGMGRTPAGAPTSGIDLGAEPDDRDKPEES